MRLVRNQAVVVALLGCVWLCPVLEADDTTESRYEYIEAHMAVPFKFLLYTSDESRASRASALAFERIKALNRILSDYDPESELSQLGRASGGPAREVSRDLFEVLDRSRFFYERSGGFFDITIAPVGRLWRRARRERKLPDPEVLAAAMKRVGGNKLELDRRTRTARLVQPGMRLDVGGIAKGYAAQEALQVIKGCGIHRALVAAAGDIVVGDPPPGAAGWKVAIAPVEPTQQPPPPILLVQNAAVSTAGDAEQFVIIDGRRYSHIINPKTGLGVEDRASVTVVAPDGASADALETTVYLMGPEKGLALIEELPGVSAYYQHSTPQGVVVFESRRFGTVPRLTSKAAAARGRPQRAEDDRTPSKSVQKPG